METYFAPAGRTERRQLRNQIMDISQSPVMDALLKTASGLLVVLNEDRQIIALNHAFLEKLGVDDIQEVLGLRLGESLKCIHSHGVPAGCGTTEYCASCGAAIAMMSAIQDDKKNEQICALVSDRDGRISDICLQVRAQPIQVDGHRWILFYAQDVTQHQFWYNLDRVFFHDVNNTLTALYGNVQLLEMNSPDNPGIRSIRETVDRLVSEVAIQKDLSSHKDIAYTPAWTIVALSQVKNDLDTVISGHRSAQEKGIAMYWTDKDPLLKTDPLLLSRVLGNMVINALEATPKGETIKIWTQLTENSEVRWEVWNPAPIPDKIKKRIFQRYFSSKPGHGRGLGTYSIKLFGETYLNGRVRFESSEHSGTRFIFTLPFTPADE